MGVILRKRKLKGNRVSLRLEYNYNYSRKTESLGLYLTDDKKKNKENLLIAEKIRAEREYELSQNRFNLHNYNKSKVRIKDYYKKVISEKKKGDAAWENSFKKFDRFVKDNLRIIDIDEDFLKKYKQFLLDDKYIAQNSAHLYFSKLSQVLNQAVKEKFISSNPCKNIFNIKQIPTAKKYLTLEEVNKIMTHNFSNKNVKYAFLFSCFTGLRISDIYNLTWDKITEDRIEFRQKKTGNMEYLPLSETAKNILEKIKNNCKVYYIDDNRKIFSLPSSANLSRAVKRLAKASGIKKDITFHSARHTFAVMSLNSGMHFFTLQKLLGHKKITTTEIYANIVNETKNNEIKKLPVMEVI